MKYTPHDAALDFVDRILAACGGGRYLIVGTDVTTKVRAFRWRGVEAVACALDANTFVGAPGAEGAPMAPGTITTLGPPDVIVLDNALDGLPPPRLDTAIDVLRTLAPRALVANVSGARHEWEQRFVSREWRKHPLGQVLVSYNALDQEDAGALLLLEPLPVKARLGRAARELVKDGELRMDMLREASARADAHVARYDFARKFVRPGDRVLDAACGLGYGTAILADGTLAQSVVGVDVKEWAIDYATEHYGRGRTRVTFQARDISAVSSACRASFDVITCFETLDQLTNPAHFLAECNRILTPGGRLICSIPNSWLGDSVPGTAGPLQAFNRHVIEQLCEPFFQLEHAFGQTSGDSAPGTPSQRAMWDAEWHSGAAESWVLVAMTDPFGSPNLEFRHGQISAPVDDHTNLLAYERDYERPWLLRSMVSIGLRTESTQVLDRLASRAIAQAAPTSADYGAALSVQAYQQLRRPEGVESNLLTQIDAYCAGGAANPHAHRWQISLRYVQGLAHLDRGEPAEALRALEQCATSDPLRFNALVSTKVVAAAWLLGWMAMQAGDLDRARSWWTAGITAAERAVQRPWEELLVNWSSPVLFGLREATHIIDLASKCATGLHLLPHAADRPGMVAAEFAQSMGRRLEHHDRTSRRLGHIATQFETAASAARSEAREAAAEAARLKSRLRATSILATPDAELPANLKIAIFGAGASGQRALARLKHRGATVDCFADNNATKWYESIAGVPVVSPAALRARKVDVIAVAALTARESIFAQLARLGYHHGHDFDVVTM